jgi:hypothetical protein
VTEQGYPPRQTGRSGRSRVSHEPRKTGWQMLDAFDESASSESDAPPWAVPGGIEPVRPARRGQRTRELDDEPDLPLSEPDGPDHGGQKSGRSRAAAARRRRSKRRLVNWGAVVLVIAIVAGAWWYLTRSPAPKSPYVTALQKGEFSSVPDACKVIGASSLHGYLAGTPSFVQPVSSKAQSQCTYTVDAKPTFRVLNITIQAYTPSLTVPTGDGSATTAATYTYGQQKQLLAKPPANTPLPPATISTQAGLGDQAITAVQVIKAAATTDRVTVLARYRNVLVQVYLSGQASGGFGPVSVSELQSGALAVAHTIMTAIKHQSTIG